ncbi:hypothetical protein ACP4OV_012005 [Aristida adscensionis]
MPENGMLSFDTPQFEGIVKKLSEFSATLSSDSVNSRTSQQRWSINLYSNTS